MSMWPWKLLTVLLLIVQSTGSCSKDSSEEHAGGVSTVVPAYDFTVISTIPEENATKVSVNTSFVIYFNREIKTGGVNEKNFSLSTNGSAVSVTVSLSKNIVVLLPSFSLSEGTIYTAAVWSEVEDTSGNSLGQDSSWKFTTVSSPSGDLSDNSTSPDNESASDTTKPSIISITPADNSSSIPVNTTIIVVFSEEFSSVSLSSSTFKLLDNMSNCVSSSFSINGSTVTFTPADNLSYFQDYKVSLTTGIQDTAENALTSASSTGFETLGGVVITSADSNGIILLS